MEATTATETFATSWFRQATRTRLLARMATGMTQAQAEADLLAFFRAEAERHARHDAFLAELAAG